MSDEFLIKLAHSVNIYDDILDDEYDADLINKIKRDVKEGYTQDLNSRSAWLSVVKKVMDIATMSIQHKSDPWDNCSNVKYPLIPMTALRYAADTYPLIIKNNKLVYPDVIGFDPNGQLEQVAQLIASHMSYQCLIESDTWEAEMDKTLHVYPIVGVAFKKTYYDPMLSKNVSELCLHDEIIVNDNIKSLETAPRITHILHKTTNELIELMRYGYFCEVETEDLDKNTETEIEEKDYHKLLEQHCYLDLDEDGYKEPYIVTYHEKLDKILRIVARFDISEVKYNDKKKVCCIKPIQYFTDFHAIPRPDGKFHSLGLGTLLLHPNEVINTLFNQLIDKGSLQNRRPIIATKFAGLPGGLQLIKPGQVTIARLEGPDMNLEDQIKVLDLGEPSQTLAEILEIMMNSSKEFASMTEVATGASGAEDVKSGVVNVLQENSQKVFSAMQTRLERSLTKEFEKLYRLNTIYLSPVAQFKTLDGAQTISKDLYKQVKDQIKMVGNPNLSSVSNKLNKYGMISQLSQMFPGVINGPSFVMAELKEAEIPNPQSLINPPQQPQPNPDLMKIQAQQQQHQQEMQLKAAELQLKQQQMQMDAAKIRPEIEKIQAQTAQHAAKTQETHIDTELSIHDHMHDKGMEHAQLKTDHSDAMVEHSLAIKKLHLEEKRLENEARAADLDRKSRDNSSDESPKGS